MKYAKLLARLRPTDFDLQPKDAGFCGFHEPALANAKLARVTTAPGQQLALFCLSIQWGACVVSRCVLCNHTASEAAVTCEG